MNKYIKKYLWCFGLSLITLGMVSCEDYLDKEEDSILDSENIFTNFYNFQGFIEELYYCIPDFAKAYWDNSFNWGEDEIISADRDYFYGYKIDQGNFWGWQQAHDGWNAGWLDGRNNTTTNERMWKKLWPSAWYGIRKANIGIEKWEEIMNDPAKKAAFSTIELNMLAGQMYFFRGWFHFQLIQYFGGLPYLDRVLPADEQFSEPRLSYHGCADKAASDFRKAADLLPIDWDDTEPGRTTIQKNQLRINKIMALGFLGKNYLWAGSPLMNNESTGNTSYNQDYCRKAAEAFGELLNLVELGETQYSLVDFAQYSGLFYTNGQSWQMPGSTEAIFRGPSYEPNGTNWGLCKQYVAKNGVLEDSGPTFSPTANYVSYYGMANGLPINQDQSGKCDMTKADSESGYDPSYPWKGRDPRFYHNFVFDTKKCITTNLSSSNEPNRYANLYSGGSYMHELYGSRTGYMMYKFIPSTINKFDGGYNWGNSNHIHIPWMRLADIYLMYAEAAANAYGSAAGKSDNFSKTAVESINRIRTRAGVSDVAGKYLGSLDAFMLELRRERAVELAYEGHRFNDLRRWYLLTEYPYTLKTRHEFDRAPDAVLSKTDAEACKSNGVLNLKEEVILERRFSEKHYWLPLKISDVTIYADFYQNPGW